ncbi:MAG TPA: AprI/Inh family metalloprotease inhibitor [Pseudolabrys sp.]|nr:AprI/Inh family metalloprotease inhibitor [Pseudolabrys sp.]
MLTCASCGAFAQTPPPQLGDSAKAVLGTWEFSNADREKVCSVTFKSDPSPVGFRLAFDPNCATLFPLVADIAGWKFPDNDLLYLLDARGKALVSFSEVENGIYEAPTPGVGVLFLQNAADAAAPGRQPDELAGDWAIVRSGAPLCTLALTAMAARDNLALTVKPGCDPAIERENFQAWQIDRDEMVLYPARGKPWRFEEADKGVWRRVPEGADPISLVKR